MIRRVLIMLAMTATLFSLTAPLAYAQPTGQCMGDPVMCAQIQTLQQQLATEKQLSANKDQQVAQVAAQSEADHRAKAAKFMSVAATISVILKMIISGAKSWTDFFTTDKGKAAIKIGTIILGFAAFILTNVGMGVPVWGALIVAGGPPGAIVVHELMDLIPVLRGKKPLASVPAQAPINPQDPQNQA